MQRYDRWLVQSRDAVLAKRGRGFMFEGRRLDEYGMLNFGDAMHKLIADDSRPDFGIHWETEYYDFPHALFLHFFRTGDMKSFRTGVEAAVHLADVDISHHEAETGFHGAARTGRGSTTGRAIRTASSFHRKAGLSIKTRVCLISGC